MSGGGGSSFLCCRKGAAFLGHKPQVAAVLSLVLYEGAKGLFAPS